MWLHASPNYRESGSGVVKFGNFLTRVKFVSFGLEMGPVWLLVRIEMRKENGWN